ncbi:hypothetical protein L596_014140 [Steinernema carpocapsae]|uniref:Uncharacterized protein n=1 Tax=Steinernema carpocapsae TaxID=34508 RepID=A0A4U5NBU9_STECR|nr:hypothetical protein L596_014140 [Steinernema carpocapsae]
MTSSSILRMASSQILSSESLCEKLKCVLVAAGVRNKICDSLVKFFDGAMISADAKRRGTLQFKLGAAASREKEKSR